MDAAPADDDEVLTREEAARLLKFSARTLDRQPDLQRVHISRRRIVYRKADLRTWLAARTRLGNSSGGADETHAK